MQRQPADILVIKLGALGDFVQAFGPMAAIRKHHTGDNITLLTTAPFESLACASGYFDRIILDKRPKWHDLAGWISLRKKLNGGNYFRVYDLQNNDRTAFYLKLFKIRPEWVGAAPGASHRNTSSYRTAGKAFDGHVQTLALAGIDDVAVDTLSWMKPNHNYAELPKPYVLLIVGASPQHPQKRWPYYAEFSILLAKNGFTPVIIGGVAEKSIADNIAAIEPTIIDLTGQTSLTDLPSLARGAAACIGNDTGPMHFIAPTGCRSLVLFSGKSNPIRHAPLGEHVVTLQQNDLKKLEPQTVWSAFSAQPLS
jgi:ADP-heptose:LPS heptosyltransferase